ncbi:MAG: DNA internalization-related competence protein ComEC/Rec2, partial [Candidatus Omnitrophota bacterium]
FILNTPREVILYGAVSSDPEWKGPSYARDQKFSFSANKLLVRDTEHNVTGSVLVRLFSGKNLPEVGDRLVLGGMISIPKGKTNPAGFDYKAYLGHKGIRAVLYSREGDHYLETGKAKTPVIILQRFLFRARENASRMIKRNLTGEAEAITGSIILGQRGGITDEISDTFIKTGTMHILAVSGLHVGIVALVLLGILRLVRLPRNLAYILTIIGICAFALFAGGRPSSLRAAIMGSFVLFGLMLGRKADLLNALAISALLIVFFQPGQLFQAGFILSYMAVLSIIYVTPLTDSLFGVTPRGPGESKLTKAKRFILKSFSVSLAVWVGMIPVIAIYFRIITPSVILANLIAVPVLSVLIVLSFSLFLPVAIFISPVISFITQSFIKIMEALSRVPFFFMRVPAPNILLTLVYFTALIGFIVLFHRRKEYRKLILVFLLFAANLFLWNELLIKPPSSFQTTFFDVKKADASVLEFTDGSVMIIDGGSAGEWTGSDAGRNILAPYFWQRGIRTIDCVLLTHDHEDHIGGLIYILKNFDVRNVIDGGGKVTHGPGQDLYKKFKKIIKDKNIRHLKIERGDILEGLPDAKFYCFNPPGDFSYGDPNNDSIVVKAITDNGNSIIFCADAGSKAMDGMLLFGSLLKSDIIKVPHHGGKLGKMSVAREFLKEVNPSSAIISTTANYVRKGILEEFKKQGIKVYTTFRFGAITAEDREDGFKIDTEN